jgi:hypothetical protein
MFIYPFIPDDDPGENELQDVRAQELLHVLCKSLSGQAVCWKPHARRAVVAAVSALSGIDSILNSIPGVPAILAKPATIPRSEAKGQGSSVRQDDELRDVWGEDTIWFVLGVGMEDKEGEDKAVKQRLRESTARAQAIHIYMCVCVRVCVCACVCVRVCVCV